MNPVNIMIVDDSRGDRRLIQEALKEVKLTTDYNLYSAEDGIEAIELLGLGGQNANPDTEMDLIILDLNMPRMDGREFLGIIKNHEQLSSIPVIVLTTSSNESDIFEAYRLKANCYVTKPLDIGEFIVTVQKLCDFWMSVVMLPKSA